MHKCDFCGKEQNKVKRMIAGKGVDICDECVLVCMEVLIIEVTEGLKEIDEFKKGVENHE